MLMWGFPKSDWAMTGHKAVTICVHFLSGWLFSPEKTFNYMTGNYTSALLLSNTGWGGGLGFQHLVLKLALDSFVVTRAPSSPSLPHHPSQLRIQIFPYTTFPRRKTFAFSPMGRGQFCGWRDSRRESWA